MKAVLDANVLFASLIKKGKSREIIFGNKLRLIAPKFVLDEFIKHKDEVISKSKLSEAEFFSVLGIIESKVEFFTLESFKDWLKEAESITPDKDDVEYVALALKFGCPLWSEDKELKNQKKVTVLNTIEMSEKTIQ